MKMIASKLLAQTRKSGGEATTYGNEGFVKGSVYENADFQAYGNLFISLQSLSLQAWRLQAKIWMFWLAAWK